VGSLSNPTGHLIAVSIGLCLLAVTLVQALFRRLDVAHPR